MIKSLKIITLGSVILLSLIHQVHAEANPKRTKYDKRTRVVNYHPQQVFRIKSYTGYSTTIVLGKDEIYKGHTLGDPDAWNFAQSGRYLFLRPIQTNADTNLFVVTNKRHYNFSLNAYTKKNKTYKPRQVDLFMVEFRYPKEIAKTKKTKRSKKRLERALKKHKNLMIHSDYQGCGDRSIAPSVAYDNGTHTFFKFSSETALPSIYYLNEDGEESIPNYSFHRDWISIHQIAKEFILRRGDTVACVVNLNDVLIPRPSSGTISSDVRREVK